MKKINLIIIILILIIGNVLYAGDVGRKGTTGAEELLIPVGARGIATGGAFLSTLSGLESIYYNPAGLDLTQQTEAMFSYMTYIADINISYFAISTGLGDIGSIALSFKTFDFGKIPVTTADFPDGTGQTYSPGFLISTLTYSKVLTDRISVGANFKLLNESIQNTSAVGFAIDMGVQYRFNNNISMGASLKNIGTNMQFTGQGLQTSTTVPGTTLSSGSGNFEIVTEPFQIPSYFELSLAYNYNFDEQNNLIVASTYTANNSLEDIIHFGMEYSFMDNFFVRGGYNSALGANANSIYGFTAGAGVDYKIGDGMGITFDYAYRDVKDFPTSNHVFTVKLALQ